MHYVHFFCPGRPNATIVAKYEQALAPIPSARIIWHTPAGLSSVFVTHAERWRDGAGLCVPALARLHEPELATSRSMVGFSAGCWAIRQLLAHPDDRAAIDAAVMLDGMHDGGTSARATGRDLGNIALYAATAKSGRGLLWVGHTDVQTHGYASTTAAAAKLLEMVGGEGGGFLVAAYDLKPAAQAKAEHGAALTEWGPGFVAEALVPMMGLQPLRVAEQLPAGDGLQGPASPQNTGDSGQGATGYGPKAAPASAPWLDPSHHHAERCVLWSLAQLGKPVETAGANAGPLIAEYMSGAERSGKPVGIRSGNWCVAAACFGERECLLPGDPPLLPWRVSGKEAIADAQATGRWHSAEDVRRGLYMPRRGDCVAWVRPSGADPRKVWTRHWARLTHDVDLEAGRVLTIDANSGPRGDSWATNNRPLDSPDLLGFREDTRPVRPKLDGDTWARVVQTSADVVAGRYGLEDALEGLDVPPDDVA